MRIVNYQFRLERRKDVPVVSKNKKGELTCRMCKDYKVNNFSYIYKTHNIPPKTLSEEFIICEKCAVRESGKPVKELPLNQ
tara:strand:- start:474 stop:716 length:243 start_codon:yes stop_codon:yes gene_type:complete